MMSHLPAARSLRLYKPCHATKKTPINPVVLLEQLMKIITVYPLESVKMYDNIQQTVNVKQKKELHPEIIISESFNI